MTAPCGSFCHAFDNRSLHFVNWGETLMMVDRLLKSTPDGKLTMFKPRLFGGQNVWLSDWRFSRCKFLRFWWCEREHRHAAVIICNSHISRWCRVAIVFAKHHVAWCLTFRLVAWKWLLRSPRATQRRARSTAAGIIAFAISHCQTSGVDVFLESSWWVNE